MPLQVLDNLLLLSVWDGHGGGEASSFCAENVEMLLERQIEKHGEGLDLGQALRQVRDGRGSQYNTVL